MPACSSAQGLATAATPARQDTPGKTTPQTTPVPPTPQAPATSTTQDTPDKAPPVPSPDTAKQGTPTPDSQAVPNTTAPVIPGLQFSASGPYRYNPVTGDVSGSGNVIVSYSGTTIHADQVEGNLNSELIFSGHAKIETKSAFSYADAIHFFPSARQYRLDNPRSVLSPDFLEHRVYDNVYVTGRDLLGNRTGYSLADNTVETTCIEPFHHYELRSRDAQLFPHKKLVLHQTSVFLFGAKLLTIPYILIPLDQRPRPRARTNYFPEFGQNFEEGYYGRFPYEFPIGSDAATYVQVSATQKLGERLHVEQEYLAGKQASFYDTSGAGFGGGIGGGIGTGVDSTGSINSAFGYGNIGPRLPRLGVGLGPASGGLFTIQGYTSTGLSRNFNTSFRHQQGIGSNNQIGFSTELQKQSFVVTSGQTNQNTKFDFAHTDSTHGVNLTTSLGLQTTDSGNFSTSQITGSLHNSFDFAAQGSNRNSLSYQFDLSRLLSTSTTPATDTTSAISAITRTAHLDGQLQFQHTSREYSYTFNTNKTIPFGFQSSGSSFGTLEKLPEFDFRADTINFKGGTLRNVPATLELNLGRYNEPTNQINTERLLAGINIPQITIMRGRTEIITGGGFEQRIYGDGAAQYKTSNNTRLRQHLGGRSGIDLNYTYEQPEGGTPFAFDIFNRSHYLTAEGGYLDDKNFQFTLRSGYDLSGSRNGGKPWQTLSARGMWRPTPSVRFDTLGSYDPNTGKFFAITQQARFRGPNDFALDVVTRIDPNQIGIRRKFAQINTQFDFPLGRTWRLAGLLRFNGNTGLFESRAAELVHEWDCLEASFSYSETPGGFRNDKQFYFALRVKAFPTVRRFNRGPAGEALGVGVGDIY